VDCLAETVVLEFLAGGLSEAAAASVDDHVDSCPSCRQLLRAVARSSASPDALATVSRDLARSPTVADLGAALPLPLDLAGGFERGAKLGRYLILDVLGKGGMGVVYAAFDPELDRKVALKLLRPELAGGEAGAMRLLREGRAIAKLAHPNVVTVFDVGTHDGAVFVAMELVDGTSLDAWLDEAPRAWREVVGVFLQAGEGLVAAHAAGMVHRDFKPANVLLGKDGRARVTDFGLARFGDADVKREDKLAAGRGDARITRTGALVGTPAYMAPEQFAAREVDAKSDQFSFAVSLYEALYGERPFPGLTISEIHANIVADNVWPAPSGAPVPAWLRSVVLRGLLAKPDERFPSLEAMLRELRRDRSRQRRVIGGAVLAIAAAAAGTALLVRSGEHGPTCELAAAPVAKAWNATRRAALAKAFVASGAQDAELLVERVSANLDEFSRKLEGMYVEACTATNVTRTQSAQLLDLRTDCLDRRAGELEALVDVFVATTNPKTVQAALQSSRQLGSIEACADTKALTEVVPPPADPSARAKLAELEPQLQKLRARRLAGEIKDARPEAEALAQASEQLDYAPFRAKALFELADIMVRLGEYEKADAMMEQSIDAAARGRDHKQVAQGYLWRVTNVGQNLGRFDKGLELAEIATRANDQAGTDPKIAAQLHASRAHMLTALGKPAEAVVEAKKSLEIRQQQLPEETLFLARGHLALGTAELATGNEKDAATHFEAARVTMEKALHPNHPELITLLHNYGELVMHQGDLDRARELNERAVAIARRAFGDDNTSMFAPMNNLGEIATQQLRYKDALAIYLEMQRLAKGGIDPKHPFHGVVAGNLGGVYLALGELDNARTALEQSVAHLEKTVGPKHDAIAEPILALARVYEAKKERKRADAAFARAIEYDGDRFANGLSWYGQTLLDRGDPKRALAILERAVTNLDKRGKHTPHEAATRFRYAQARWLTGKRDAETRAIVEAAADYIASLKLGDPQFLNDLRAWLASHRV